MKTIKRWFAILLALSMIFTTLAPAAFADEIEVEETAEQTEVTESEPEALVEDEEPEEPDPVETPTDAEPEIIAEESAPVEQEEPTPEAPETELAPSPEASEEGPVEPEEAPAEPGEEPAFDGAEEEPVIPASVEATVESVTVEGGADNDELFAGFVSRAFGLDGGAPSAGGPRKAKKNVGSSLSGFDLAIYNALLPKIKAVAAGGVSSTVFEFDAATLGLDQPYTAADLGVSSVIENGVIPEEASKALVSKGFSLSKITAALLADAPYDLYWYNKGPGAGCKLSASITGSSRAEPEQAVIYRTKVTFKFSVASEYSAGDYKVTSVGEKVKTAVAYAQSIVDRNAGKSDYEKLVAYRDKICADVEYNTEAVEQDAPYGNPWQLIWVFDQDPDTKVVCEGYSKAFQYLCDLSDFTATTCYTVSGTMSGGTGAGGHMWNTVSMNDGRNYLVDVTNCDSGTVGHPDRLFLKGYASGDVNSGYSFTCGSQTIHYSYNAKMPGIYSEADLTLSSEDYTQVFIVSLPQGGTGYTVAADGETIVSTGGSVTLRVNVADGEGYARGAGFAVKANGATIAPNSDGSYTISDIQSDQTVTVTGVLKAVAAVAPTCDKGGNSAYYVDEDGNIYGSLTSTQTVTEAEITLAALGHDWDDGVVTTEPGCETEGVKTFTCRNDATHNKTEAVPVLGHNYTDSVTSPTCTERGYTTHTCSRCDDSYVDSYVDALGHDWNDGEVTTPATCEEEGVKTFTCQHDSSHTTTESIPALGHDWNDGEVTTPATCEEEGVKTFTCQHDSSHTTTESIPALGHDWDEWTVVTEATETEAGQETRICHRDTTHVETREIPKLVPTATATATPTPVPPTETSTPSTTTATPVPVATATPKPAPTSIASAKVTAANQTWTGKALTPAVTVTLNGKTLAKDTDYTVAYANNTNAGTATVTVNGKGNYTGTAKGTFKIAQAKNAITAKNIVKTYKAKAQSFKLGATAQDGAKLTYKSNNKNVTVSAAGKVTVKKGFVGKATVTITAAATKNCVKTEKKVTVTVNPAAVKLSSVKNTAAKKITVKWNKSTNTKATGYQIQYATNSKFTKAKTVTVKGVKNVSKVISKLSKGKTYYVRVRVYQTVSKVNYYSAWSAAKKVKITK